MTATGTQAVDRATTLVSLVVRSRRAPTASELAAQAGLAKSTTARLLVALERGGMLQRDDDGVWSPGRLFAAYAASPDSDARLARSAAPVMEGLGALTRETVHLAVVRGDGVEHIAQVESTYLVSSRDWIGVGVAPHCSALGKVLYAYGALNAPQGPLEQPTSSSLTTFAAVEEQFPAIRRSGYAVTVDELEVGLTGIAAPVIVDGAVVAALGISGPTTRLEHAIAASGRAVSQQATALSRLLHDRKRGAA